MILIKLFLSRISKIRSQKVKSKVYFDILSQFFCGVGFKARQTNGSDLLSIHSATPLQLLIGSFSFDELPLSALPYGTMSWPIESEFILSLINIMLILIGL